MSDPRWSDETEQLVAREVYAFGISAADQVLPATEQFPGYDVDDQEVRNACLQGARQFLTALADAGLLVPADARRYIERGSVVEVEDGREFVSQCNGPDCDHADEPGPDRMRHAVMFKTPWVEIPSEVTS